MEVEKPSAKTDVTRTMERSTNGTYGLTKRLRYVMLKPVI